MSTTPCGRLSPKVSINVADGQIVVSGTGNDVEYKHGDPKIVNSGSGNDVTKD